MGKHVDYRRMAFNHYAPVCVHCGFGVRAVLEVAHLDCDRSHNSIDNLAILCPTCHKMYDLDLIPQATIVAMRDQPKEARWAKRMKDAGRKAALTRRQRQKQQIGPGIKAAFTRKWRAAGLKAAQTRARKKAAVLRNGKKGQS